MELCGNMHNMSSEGLVFQAREPDLPKEDEPAIDWSNLPPGAEDRAKKRALHQKGVADLPIETFRDRYTNESEEGLRVACTERGITLSVADASELEEIRDKLAEHDQAVERARLKDEGDRAAYMTAQLFKRIMPNHKNKDDD